MQSPRFSWNSSDTQAWVRQALKFIVPVALIYLTPILMESSKAGHVPSVSDFMPTGVTLGAIQLYILNRIYDALARFVSGEK